jgi:hypothetical protein
MPAPRPICRRAAIASLRRRQSDAGKLRGVGASWLLLWLCRVRDLLLQQHADENSGQHRRKRGRQYGFHTGSLRFRRASCCKVRPPLRVSAVLEALSD